MFAPFPTPPPWRTNPRLLTAHPPWPPGDGLRTNSGGEFRHRYRDVDRPPPISTPLRPPDFPPGTRLRGFRSLPTWFVFRSFVSRISDCVPRPLWPPGSGLLSV
jgi:hypothetical protein